MVNIIGVGKGTQQYRKVVIPHYRVAYVLGNIEEKQILVHNPNKSAKFC